MYTRHMEPILLKRGTPAEGGAQSECGFFSGELLTEGLHYSLRLELTFMLTLKSD